MPIRTAIQKTADIGNAERYIYYDFTPYLMSQSYTRLFGLLPMWPRLSTTDSMLKIKLSN